MNWDPKTLDSKPGVAKSWDISSDNLTYTFHIRPEAKWSDGSPITAGDFVWQWRRLLDPLTASEYSYQLWYLENAERYTNRQISPGDPVEIELFESAPGALPFARGKVLHGKLIQIIKPTNDSAPSPGVAPPGLAAPIYSVDIDGQPHWFQTVLARDFNTWKATTPPPDHNIEKIEPCKTVLLDFNEVGVKALDDHTLQVKLKSPTPYFLFLAGYYPLYATNPRCVETYGYPGWTKARAHRYQRRVQTRKPPCPRAHSSREERSILERRQRPPQHHRRPPHRIPPHGAKSLHHRSGRLDFPKFPPPSSPSCAAKNRADYAPTPEMNHLLLPPQLHQTASRQSTGPQSSRPSRRQAGNRRRRHPRRRTPPPSQHCPAGLTGYTPANGEPFNLKLAQKLLADAGYPGGRGFPKNRIALQSQRRTSVHCRTNPSSVETESRYRCRPAIHGMGILPSCPAKPAVSNRPRWLGRRLSRPQHLPRHVDVRQSEQRNRLVEQRI